MTTPNTELEGREQATTRAGRGLRQNVIDCFKEHLELTEENASLLAENAKLKAALESIQNCGHIYKCRPCERIARAALADSIEGK